MQFHIGDVLTVTTGKLLSRGGVAAAYKILNYMTGDDLMTHQLPRAARAAKPTILEQYPQLAEETGEGVDEQNIDAYLAGMAEKFGEKLELKPLAAYEKKDPTQELQDMMGGMSVPVIVITVPEAEEKK